MPHSIPSVSLREFALGIFFVTILAFVHTWAYQDERIAEAEHLSRTLKEYGSIYAQCLNGDVDILWTDDLLKVEKATTCRTEIIGKRMERI